MSLNKTLNIPLMGSKRIRANLLVNFDEGPIHRPSRIDEQYPEPPDILDIFAGAPRGKVNTPARFLRVLRSRFSQEFPTIYRTLSSEPMWILFKLS